MGIFNESNETSEVRVGKIDAGEKHVTSIRASQVTDTTSRAVWVENPTDSGLDLYLVARFVATGRSEAVIATDVSQDGTGSTTTVLNAKPVVGPATVANTRTQDSYTINGKQISLVIPGAAVTGGAGGGAGEAPATTTFLLEEGNTMLFRVTNRSGGSADVGVSLVWFEVEL